MTRQLRALAQICVGAHVVARCSHLAPESNAGELEPEERAERIYDTYIRITVTTVNNGREFATLGS